MLILDKSVGGDYSIIYIEREMQRCSYTKVLNFCLLLHIKIAITLLIDHKLIKFTFKMLIHAFKI